MTALLLGYRDLPAARDFFTSRLGFREEWARSDPNGDLARSHVRLADTVLMLDRPGYHGVKSPAAGREYEVTDPEGYVFAFIT